MDLKKYLMAGGLSLVLVLGACGGDTEETDDSADDAATEESSTEEESTTEESSDEGAEDTEESDDSASTSDVDAEGVAQSSCASCHGGDFQGGMGPALEGTSLSEEEFTDVVRNGRGSMPDFSEDQVSEEELTAMYDMWSE